MALLPSALVSQPIYREVEQGSQDASPFATSSRIFRNDLRVPSNFDKVYRVDPSIRLYPGQPVPREGDGLFARVHGGMIAVYRQGQYQRSGRGAGRGTTVGVPGDTVFILGDAKKYLLSSSPRAVESGSGNSLLRNLNTKIDARLEAPSHTNLFGPETRPPTRSTDQSHRTFPSHDALPELWQSDRERCKRVAVRLDEALMASEADPQPR